MFPPPFRFLSPTIVAFTHRPMLRCVYYDDYWYRIFFSPLFGILSLFVLCCVTFGSRPFSFPLQFSNSTPDWLTFIDLFLSSPFIRSPGPSLCIPYVSGNKAKSSTGNTQTVYPSMNGQQWLKSCGLYWADTERLKELFLTRDVRAENIWNRVILLLLLGIYSLSASSALQRRTA